MVPAAIWLTRGEHLRNLEGHDFEWFCQELLDFEVSHRHVNGRVGGGAGQYVGDDGMDLAVVITESPRIPRTEFPHALTLDEPGTTCVSCKGAANWRALLKRDAPRNQRPVDTLAAGGRFTMVVNRQVSEAATEAVIREVADLLAVRLALPTAEVVPRLSLLDADDLASFLAYHPVALDTATRTLLHIPALPGLMTYEEWHRFQKQERDIPTFSADEQRERAVEAISTFCARAEQDRSGHVLWVCGPPGVGKSRLVLEAIAAVPAVLRRTWIAAYPELGRHAVESTDLPRHNGVVLVVDECPAGDIRELAAAFVARCGHSNATLILVGPPDASLHSVGAVDVRVDLGPLATPAAERLIAGEMTLTPDERPELVRRVSHLAEGYAWFAVLLSRALHDDAGALAGLATQWEAAKIAIAGRPRDYGNDNDRYERVVSLRTRALFAATLTEGVSWPNLRKEDTDRLGRALGVSWEETIAAAEDCRRRGLLRVRQDWTYKYVTPNNLARLVAIELLRPPYSVARRLREHVPQLLRELYTRLDYLAVEPALLADLVEADLARPRSWEAADPAESVGSLPLRLLAKWHPVATARRLRADVEARSIQDLRADTAARRDLVSALDRIRHRSEGFEDAEAALFRLAVAENESWSNNATGVWSSLFLVAINVTHRNFASRLAVLQDRVLTGPSEFRLVALEGLEVAVSGEHGGAGYSDDDTVDGPWPTPTFTEVIHGKQSAWRLLLKVMSDADPAVAARARNVAVASVRAAAWWRILPDALVLLAEAAGEWTAEEMAQLREQLDALESYDAPLFEGDSASLQALQHLREVSRPRSYHDRLLDVVGRWEHHVPIEHHREHEAEQDLALAREGLAPPLPLLAELTWLDSEEAVRATPLAICLGTVDTQRALLTPLVDLARAGGAINTLPAYLLGLARAGAESKVDALLRGWRGIPDLALHTMLAVAKLGPSDERIGWIVEDLRTGSLDPKATAWLGRGGWGRAAGTEPLRNLIETLASTAEPAAQVTALDLIREQFERPAANPDELMPLTPILGDLVRRLARINLSSRWSRVWEQGCRLLLQHADAAAAAAAAVDALQAADGFGSDRHAWAVLAEALAADPDTVWSLEGAALEAESRSAYRLILEAASNRLVAKVPIGVVLDWIGADTRRATLVAGICPAHEAPLNELARRLIALFGANSAAASALRARAYSTIEMVTGGMFRFYERQLAHARQWQQDPEPEVARWGAALVPQFEADLEREAAREEYERRRR